MSLSKNPFVKTKSIHEENLTFKNALYSTIMGQGMLEHPEIIMKNHHMTFPTSSIKVLRAD